jgi:hypothetical protein
MNRIPFAVGTIAMLALLGCAPKNEPPVAQAPAPAAAEAVVPEIPAGPVPEGVLPMSYMDAGTALAADDFDKARVSLTALATQGTGELKTRAQVAADAADISSMRDAFKELSAIASQMQLPPEYAVAFCPMYKGGSKWVQKKETLANPYFGKSMLTCGNFLN